MNTASLLAVLRIMDLALSVTAAAGLTLAQWQSIKARAAAEGREVNLEDLDAALDRAAAAIARIDGTAGATAPGVE